MSQLADRIKYSILDPTGNITALVETETEISLQPEIAAEIMKQHPEVEQVGFVRFYEDGNVNGELRMAGGEFCGNASMSAAALCLLRRTENSLRNAELQKAASGAEIRPQIQTIILNVSGAEEPVAVSLQRQEDCSFSAVIEMPPVPAAEETEFTFAELKEKLPLVRMEGISHIVIGRNSHFFRLKNEPELAEQAVQQWCAELGADGLGLMFLEEDAGTAEPEYMEEESAGSAGLKFRMTPLVYVHAGGSGGTVFWENSCASGTAAAGMYAASEMGKKSMVSLREPGGTLKAECDPGNGKVQLYGSVSLVEEITIG